MGVDLAAPRRWRALAASVAGTSHAAAGQPCADACAVRVFPTRPRGSLLVAVAADGAGSSPRAADGARMACAAILEQARRFATRRPQTRRAPRRPQGLDAFDRVRAQRWADAARRRIARAARAAGLPPRAFSCTLLVALVDERRAVFFQVGDGAIVYRDARGRYVPALWPQNGEYANCTWFVTDDDLADRVHLASAGEVHEVALLTDGLQGLALRFDSRDAHGPFFSPMFERLRVEKQPHPRALQQQLREFLGSAAVNSRTDDDKTLVLATRLPGRR